MPFEEVRDFFYDRNNYIGELDIAAEQMFTANGMTIGGLDIQLSALMRDRFGVTRRDRRRSRRARQALV